MENALIEDLVNQAEQRNYEAGEIIIRQGGRANEFFILVTGNVDVVKRVDDGGSQVVSSLTAPAIFGEVGLMEEGRRTATIRAAEQSAVELLVISKKAFQESVDASEMMADEIAASMQKYRIRDSLAAALGDLTPQEIEEVAARGRITTFQQGDLIICQGDPAAFFYILTRGRVEVLHRGAEGSTRLINFHEPGEYFGEIGLLQIPAARRRFARLMELWKCWRLRKGNSRNCWGIPWRQNRP